MQGGKQSAEFLVLLDGKTTEYVQSYQPTSSNPEIMRKYAGVVLNQGGFVQVAYDVERFQKDIDGRSSTQRITVTSARAAASL